MAAWLSIFFSAEKECVCLHPVIEIFIYCYAGIFLQSILCFFLGYCKKIMFYICSYTIFHFLNLNYVIEIVKYWSMCYVSTNCSNNINWFNNDIKQQKVDISLLTSTLKFLFKLVLDNYSLSLIYICLCIYIYI